MGQGRSSADRDVRGGGAAPERPRVLVVAAMPIELKPFNRMASLAKGSLDGAVVYRGTLRPQTGGTAGAATRELEVLGAVTGIGPERARRTLEALLGATTVDRVVMIGIAGALDPTLRIGDLVVPTEVLDGDTGARYRHTPLQKVAAHGLLRTAGAIQVDEEGLAPQRDAGVVALDMETAAVAEVSEAHGVPWSVLRAISDRVQDGIVGAATLDMTNADGSSNPWAAVKFMATRPSMIRPLAKLARDTKRATAVSAAAGVRECRAVAAS